MQETIQEWHEMLISWVVTHAIRIVIIIAASWLLNKILARIIRKTIRVAVVRDKYLSDENGRKRSSGFLPGLPG